MGESEFLQSRRRFIAFELQQHRFLIAVLYCDSRRRQVEREHILKHVKVLRNGSAALQVRMAEEPLAVLRSLRGHSHKTRIAPVQRGELAAGFQTVHAMRIEK